jgi:hypothetical protein
MWWELNFNKMKPNRPLLTWSKYVLAGDVQGTAMYSWIKTLRCAERASLQNVRCWIFYRIFDDLFCPLFCTVCMSHLTCCLEFCWGTYTANWWSNKFHQHRDRRRCTDADTASVRRSCGVYIHIVVSSVVSPGGFACFSCHRPSRSLLLSRRPSFSESIYWDRIRPNTATVPTTAPVDECY